MLSFRALRTIAPRVQASTVRSNAVRSLSTMNKIIYTETDEAPALATYALLPVINRFASLAGIRVEKSDISVAARIIVSTKC